MSDTSDPTADTIGITPHGGVLVNRWLKGEQRQAERERAKSLIQVPLSPVSVSDVEMIGFGAYSPLTGFMVRADYERVVQEMRLANGLVWPIPITLPVGDELGGKIREGQEIALVESDRILAIMEIAEKFRYSKEREAGQVYRTTDPKHPGVARLYQQDNTLLGGDIWTIDPPKSRQFLQLPRNPKSTREKFAENKWQRIVGFQTRNPIHRAHEHILKNALEIADGLFLHPLVGETKPDDIPATARIDSYRALLRNYYPRNRVLLGVFPTAMRYAGPREAVFHALCRKNYGCTHFIVGRDHAGVADYYAPNAACEIFQEFRPEEIGIEPLFCPEISYYCRICGGLVTPEICPHDQNRSRMNGTQIRKTLAQGKIPPKAIMRPEVSWILIKPILGRKPVGYVIKPAIHMLLTNPHEFKLLLSKKLKRWRRFWFEKLKKSETTQPYAPRQSALPTVAGEVKAVYESKVEGQCEASCGQTLSERG